ncbi:MAG TPA: bacterioferritin [Vicinamibacterales bacterium]|nr:bacterioferritin [Vicinamibacterales bacterium]
MKTTKKLLDALNDLLADELTAISRYMVHSQLCEEWGYGKLHKAIEHQAEDEMHHAKKLIERILFLEGRPVMSKLNPITIGKDVPEMLAGAEDDELKAVQSYNKAIVLAREAGDESTAHLLGKILRMEEGHMDWAERQRLQVQQLGLQNYLARQTKGATG